MLLGFFYTADMIFHEAANIQMSSSIFDLNQAIIKYIKVYMSAKIEFIVGIMNGLDNFSVKIHFD